MKKGGICMKRYAAMKPTKPGLEETQEYINQPY